MKVTHSASALPLPDLSGLADDQPWLLLDAAGGPDALHGFLIAGVRRILELTDSDPEAYARIADFVGQAQGRCFGWIGYDQLRAHPLLDLPQQSNVAVDSVLNIKGFDLKRTLEMDPEFLNTDGEHEHDTTVSPVSITQDGEIDLALIEDWIGVLLRKQGADLYRMKGVLHIAHATKKFVYHAVHMIFNGDFEDWDEGEPKSNKLVFIGKNLDAAALRAAFAECLATPENLEKKLQALRFKVGDRVDCHMGGGDYRAGAVTRLMWRDPEMEQGQVCPYGVLLDSGSTTWAPADVDEVIRAEGPKGQKRPLDPSA